MIVGASFTFLTVRINDANAVALLESFAVTVIVLVPTLAFVGSPEKFFVSLLNVTQLGTFDAV